MYRKLGIGAAFALTAAAVGVGCSGGSSKGGFVASNNEIGNNDNFPAGSIVQNNTSEDGAGLSENAQTGSLGTFKCVFNVDQPDSDGSSSAADGSAMVFFTTTETGNGNGQVTNRQRVYAANFASGKAGSPQELTAQDRNEALGGGDARRTHAGAAVLIPMNFSGYKDSAGASNNLVSANNGNWLIIWDYQTFNQHPNLSAPLPGLTSDASTLRAAADQNGSHHSIASTIFIKNLANQPTATSSLVGNTATSGTPNGTPTEFRNGFQVVGLEIPTNRGGASQGMVGNAPTFSGFNYRPAEDVISFGVATDGFAKTCSYGSSAADPTGLLPSSGGTKLGMVNGGRFVSGPTAIDNNGNVVQGTNGVFNAPGAAEPAFASYTPGEDVTFIQLFYVQLTTSHSGSTTVTISTTGTRDGTVQQGPAYDFFTANFNLASMTFGAPKIVPFTQTRNAATGGFQGSAQVLPDFRTYNNIVFWKYVDSSLNQSGLGSVGQSEGGFSADVDRSSVMTVLSVTPGTAGTADINASGQVDITFRGASNKHSISNSTDPNTHNIGGVGGGTHIGDEFVNFLECGGGIFGPDEGLGDTTIFVQGIVTTNLAANGTDEDIQLWAFAVSTTGVPIGGVNPKRVSVHATEPAPAGDFGNFGTGGGVLNGTGIGALADSVGNTAAVDTNLRDDVRDVKALISRDGTYVVLGWRQALGTSLNANIGLLAQVYKTFRPAASTSQQGAVVGATTMDQRFPTANPIQVNTPSNTAYAQSPTASQNAFDQFFQGDRVQTVSGFSGSPVAAWDFQGAIGYKCGFQSDRTKVAMVWLHSDGTEDRIFIKQLTVSTGTNSTDQPTLTAAGEVELETANLVSGGGRGLKDQFFIGSASTTTQGFVSTISQKRAGSTYRFLPSSHGFSEPNVVDNGGNATFQNNTGNIPVYAAPFAAPGVIPDRPDYRGFTFNPGLGTSNACTSLKPGFGTVGAGVDNLDTIDAGSSGNDGDVLVVFSKIVDATTTDGNFFNRQVVAVRYTGTSASERVVISRRVQTSGGASSDIGENVTSFGAFRTQLRNLTGTTMTASLSASGNALLAGESRADNGVYIYMNCPNTENGSSPAGVYTRHFLPTSFGNGVIGNNVVNQQQATGFPALFFPQAASTTTDAAFVNPKRLDRDLNTNATIFDIFTKGRGAIVVIEQDNHLWGAITSDGNTYSETGGLPTPLLIDNNRPAGSNTGNIGYTACKKVDSNCDNTSGSIIFFTKSDSDNNIRIYARVLQ